MKHAVDERVDHCRRTPEEEDPRLELLGQLIIGVEEDEDDHHTVVGRPAHDKREHDDHGDHERFHLGFVQKLPPRVVHGGVARRRQAVGLVLTPLVILLLGPVAAVFGRNEEAALNCDSRNVDQNYQDVPRSETSVVHARRIVMRDSSLTYNIFLALRH